MNIHNFVLFKIILEKLCVSLTYSLYHEEFVIFREMFQSITPGNMASLFTAIVLIFFVINMWNQGLFSVEFIEICGVLCSIFFSESVTKNNWLIIMEPQSNFFFVSISVYVLLMCQIITLWKGLIGKLAIPLPQFLQLYVVSTVIKKFDENHLTLCLWIMSIAFIMVPNKSASRLTSLLTAISARVIVRELNLYWVQYQDNDKFRMELLIAQLFFIFLNFSSISEKTKFLKEIMILSCAQNFQTLLLKATSSISFCFLTFWVLFVVCQSKNFQNANVLSILKYCIAFTTSLQVTRILDFLTNGYEKNAIMFMFICLLKSSAVHVDDYLKKRKYSVDKYQDKFIIVNIVDWEEEYEDSNFLLNSNLGLPGLT